MESWKTRTLIIGAILGALAGTAAAFLLVRESEEDQKTRLTAGEGVKVGMGVLGVLRLIQEIAAKK